MQLVCWWWCFNLKLRCISFLCLSTVEKVLERGERIDVLVGKAEELDHSVSSLLYISLSMINKLV